MIVEDPSYRSLWDRTSMQKARLRRSGDSANIDIQPGTQTEGRSWQSRRPESGNEDDKLDQALKDSFPTSDPP
jgi:hypothetical protein